MANENAFCARISPFFLSLLRIVVGILFLAHGSQKLLGYPPPKPEHLNLMTLMGLSAILEFLGGALILLGFLTRPVAFILSGEMAFAYFMAHAPRGLWPLQNQGELAVLYCFVFFFLAAAGGGPVGIDGLRKKG
jgi:putative oxidoreductase